jgi:hypothetical protein
MSFNPPPSRHLWELGSKEFWPELKKLTCSFAFDSQKEGFSVTDATSRELIDGIRKAFDGSRSSNGDVGVLHKMMSFWCAEEDLDLLKRVLSLGLDPDRGDSLGWTPASHCVKSNKYKSLTLLFKLRINASLAKDERQENYGSVGREEVELVLRRHLESGCPEPTIAQLALDGDFWAVLNLVRRDLITNSEALEPFRGRTALGWARYHNRMDVAKELRYRFPFLEDEESMEKRVGVLETKCAGLEAEMKALRQEMARLMKSKANE